jgi:ABC-type molybdenum transport system ATPase subunit/photorepair protein PhrA
VESRDFSRDDMERLLAARVILGRQRLVILDEPPMSLPLKQYTRLTQQKSLCPEIREYRRDMVYPVFISFFS